MMLVIVRVRSPIMAAARIAAHHQPFAKPLGNLEAKCLRTVCVSWSIQLRTTLQIMRGKQQWTSEGFKTVGLNVMIAWRTSDREIGFPWLHQRRERFEQVASLILPVAVG